MNDPTTLVPEFGLVPLIFEGAGLTHAGRVRRLNEDSILTDPTGVLWAVADGMGGHGHGDVASDIVIECLSGIPDAGDPRALLTSYLTEANRRVLAKAQEFSGATMGATVVATMINGAIAHIAWVGDSRAYLCRSGTIRLLTRDHTIVQELVDEGMLNAESAKVHEESHVITRAVGVEEVLDLDLTSVPLIHGDRLVLCSDGLTECLDDGSIREAVQSTLDPDTACRLLVSAALDGRAPDNISVIVVVVKES